MKNLRFGKAFLNGFGGSMAQKTGSVTRTIHFRAAWTDTIQESIGWTEVTESQEVVSLIKPDELAAQVFKFFVGGYEYDFGSGLLSAFKVHRLDDGKKVSWELRFTYTTMTLGVLKHVEDCAEKYARIKGEIKIQYEIPPQETKKSTLKKLPEQGELVDVTQ